MNVRCRALLMIVATPSGREPHLNRDQLCVHCDRGVEDLGNWAVLLGATDHLSKRGLAEVRDLSTQRQSRPTDAKPLALRLDGNSGLDIELCRRIAGALQHKGQCHGEASRMGSSDQLFGIGAFLVLETGPKGIRGLCQHAGLGRNCAAAVATGTAPNCFRLANHVTSPWLFAVLKNLTS